MDERLLEPVEAYKTYYEGKFHDVATEYFDELTKKSGVDVDANRETVKSYNSENIEISLLDGSLAKKKRLRTFLIILSILSGVAFAIGILCLIKGAGVAIGLPLVIGGLLLLILFPVIISTKIKPAIKSIEIDRKKHADKALEYKKEAYQQMAPLNELFASDTTYQLIEKTIPLIKIDKNFSMHRYDCLNGKYGLGENTDMNRSTVGILTGEILGNPFAIDKEIVHTMGMATYHGSLVITWTTTRTDSEGHVHVEHHSETLHASVDKPKPYYSQNTTLIYGNEAAPDLHFTHTPSHAERMGEKDLSRAVKKGTKAIQKKQSKAMKNGGNFTEMGNNEFDVLFGATDRDNEVQFRLLFTPLAQKNMLTLMKDNDIGFGDDFTFYKNGMLNFVSSEHSKDWNLDSSYKKYVSYSYNESMEQFMTYNKEYFKYLFFEFAPLLSLPLYQQHKAHEYIYKDNYHRNYTDYEAEYMANLMGESEFAAKGTATNVILKTSLTGKAGAADSVKVTAYSYRTEDRVDYVTKFGGDGRFHDVPVPWVEYIPIQAESDVSIKEINMTDREFESKFSGATQTLGGDFTFGHGLLLCVVAGAAGFDLIVDKMVKESALSSAINAVNKVAAVVKAVDTDAPKDATTVETIDKSTEKEDNKKRTSETNDDK